MRFYIVLMATLFLIGCHNPKGPTKKDLKGIAQEIMINAKNCSLITIDSLGIAHARVMDPFLPEENFLIISYMIDEVVVVLPSSITSTLSI